MYNENWLAGLPPACTPQGYPAKQALLYLRYIVLRSVNLYLRYPGLSVQDRLAQAELAKAGLAQ